MKKQGFYVVLNIIFICLIISQTSAKDFNPPLEFGNGTVDAKIYSIMTGEEAAQHGRIHSLEIDQVSQKGKHILYFDVSLTNTSFNGELTVLSPLFSLVDTEGNVYSSHPGIDYVYGEIHRGRTIRGGVYFELYEDSVPETLEYDTGLISSSTKIGSYHSKR